MIWKFNNTAVNVCELDQFLTRKGDYVVVTFSWFPNKDTGAKILNNDDVLEDDLNRGFRITDIHVDIANDNTEDLHDVTASPHCIQIY